MKSRAREDMEFAERLTRATVVKFARDMADDIERQGLPTTGPQALRNLADAVEREGRQ